MFRGDSSRLAVWGIVGRVWMSVMVCPIYMQYTYTEQFNE
jgi:hypothetical protein